eukprot:s46_g34.t1
MFGNFVENLGLKEGFAEFKEQLNKDAKTTIANTQFAKDRGIDVAKLDEWEQQIQEQAANTTAELHDRTIGRAVESLAQDETIAQLLELQSPEKEAVIEEPSEAASAPAESPASTEEVPKIAHEEAKAKAAKPRSRPDAEAEDIQSLQRSRDEAMAQAEALQVRLADVSAVSDEALEKAAHEAWLLKRAVEEKDAALASASEAQAKLEEQMGTAQRRLEDLEANFLERLQREVSQKEQELLDEVAYLRRAGEAKERRVQDLQAENGALERRLLVKASSGVSDAGDVMLEAHTAIAQAFGDLSAQHPCLRLLDEPILRLLALLFKQPLFRRMFFVASAFLWAFSLLHALTSDHSETIHVIILKSGDQVAWDAIRCGTRETQYQQQFPNAVQHVIVAVRRCLELQLSIAIVRPWPQSGAMAEYGEYGLFLKQELEKLHQKLVEKYQLDMQHANYANERSCEQVVPDQQPMKPGPPSRSASGFISNTSSRVKIDPRSLPLQLRDLSSAFPSSSSLGGLEPSPVLSKWANLTSKLMNTTNLAESDSEDEVASYVKDILTIRPQWKTALQQHALKREKTQTFKSSTPLNHTPRMKDAATDGSCLQPLVRKPSSKLQITWSLLGVLFIVWDMITIPLELFDDEGMISLLLVVGRFTFGYWILDMPLHAIFGVEIDGHLELRPRQLLKRYWRSWFGIDLMVISIDAALLIAELVQDRAPAPARSARYLRTLRLLRLLRLLRVAKLQRELTKLANSFLSTYAFMVMRVVSGLMMILAVNHIIACCWYGLGRWTLENGSSWLMNAGIADASLADSYATSIHWALTQFTPATNNVAPVNFVERFFAVWVILLAMGTFSSFISSITATVSTLRASRSEQFKHHSSLVRFFNERNLSTETYAKINDALKKQGMYDIRLKETEVSLLRGVPEHLKVVLHEEMFMNSLLSLRIWDHWSHEDDLLIHRQICHLAMVEHVASPGNDAFMPGTECTEVYLLDQGNMGYIARQFATFEAEFVSPGQVLCLPCLWAEWLHRGRLTANGGTTAYYNGINCEKFCSLVKQHGNPLWQYLQIYGILVIGEIEHMDAEDIFVTDKTLAEDKMHDIATRAGRFADMVNSRHDSEKASFMATLGAVGHHHHHNRKAGRALKPQHRATRATDKNGQEILTVTLVRYQARHVHVSALLQPVFHAACRACFPSRRSFPSHTLSPAPGSLKKLPRASRCSPGLQEVSVRYRAASAARGLMPHCLLHSFHSFSSLYAPAQICSGERNESCDLSVALMIDIAAAIPAQSWLGAGLTDWMEGLMSARVASPAVYGGFCFQGSRPRAWYRYWGSMFEPFCSRMGLVTGDSSSCLDSTVNQCILKPRHGACIGKHPAME